MGNTTISARGLVYYLSGNQLSVLEAAYHGPISLGLLEDEFGGMLTRKQIAQVVLRLQRRGLLKGGRAPYTITDFGKEAMVRRHNRLTLQRVACLAEEHDDTNVDCTCSHGMRVT